MRTCAPTIPDVSPPAQGRELKYNIIFLIVSPQLSPLNTGAGIAVFLFRDDVAPIIQCGDCSSVVYGDCAEAMVCPLGSAASSLRTLTRKV